MAQKLKKIHEGELVTGKDTGEQIKQVLLSYLKGQFVVMVVTMVASYAILTYLQVKFALLLAGVTGAFSIIPIFGMMTAAAITLIVVLVGGQTILGMSPFLGVVFILLIYFLLNQMIDWIISPLIVGKALKINPLILFIAVIIGVSVFGIVGAILTPPALGVIRVLLFSKKNKDSAIKEI